eukprot:3941589-Pyramimonas_sp.AAC.1
MPIECPKALSASPTSPIRVPRAPELRPALSLRFNNPERLTDDALAAVILAGQPGALLAPRLGPSV